MVEENLNLFGEDEVIPELLLSKGRQIFSLIEEDSQFKQLDDTRKRLFKMYLFMRLYITEVTEYQGVNKHIDIDIFTNNLFNLVFSEMILSVEEMDKGE